MARKIALIGFGEAGSTFASAGAWGDKACAFDTDRGRVAAMEKAGVGHAPDRAGALGGADLVLSLVTAGQAAEAARSCAPLLAPEALWCDMNSVAPQTKRESARAIESQGGRYVDVAILAPVNPAQMDVPLLLSGRHAAEAREMLMACGFREARVVGEEIGRASAIKMIRSVMVKGIEALSDEMLAAAERAGVAQEVLASLDASWREESWQARTAYHLERMATHGLRRAEEMEEVALTLRDLDVEPVMTAGTVKRQRAAAVAKPARRDAA